MKEQAHLFNWQVNIDGADITSIGNDLILLEKPIIKSIFDYPFKVDVTTAIICLSGSMKGFVNLKPVVSSTSTLTTILPGQILQYEDITDDFTGFFTIMSNQFINNLNIQTRTPLFMTIKENPVISLTETNLNTINTYYSLLKEAIRTENNPYQLDTVKYIIKAFFYWTSYQFHKIPENVNKSKNEILLDKFLSIVEKHYKEERTVTFYADKLNITPKYLSSLVKVSTGKFANEWIDNFVILEAEALLKSTNKTIQQISDELNFPTQSVFGKYFKRITGMSPRDYKNK
jgi:AraC-like DNA-binding protein